MRAIVRALMEKGALGVAELNCRNNRASRWLQPTFSKDDYYAQLPPKSFHQNKETTDE